MTADVSTELCELQESKGEEVVAEQESNSSTDGAGASKVRFCWPGMQLKLAVKVHRKTKQSRHADAYSQQDAAPPDMPDNVIMTAQDGHADADKPQSDDTAAGVCCSCAHALIHMLQQHVTARSRSVCLLS